jgi:trehalose-phosphatase
MTDAQARALEEALETIARVPVLLVASDYDGTLAPIVENPADARPDRESMVALRVLSTLPNTHVAVISGRALCDLAQLTGGPEEVHLVGSHGSEFDPDFARRLDPKVTELRERIYADLARIAMKGDGFLVEHKPASVAFHYRNADESAAAAALKDVEDGPASYEGVVTKHGKKVVELGVVSTSKGAALDTIRARVGASAALFMGDDVTDEDAFATLRGPDIGIKVGEGDSAAPYRIGDPHEVARLLARLAELRSAWIAGADAVAISDHALLSDERTIALVTPGARITWFCAPRIDSPALFAELLGGPSAGYFAVHPANGDRTPLVQEYRGESFVLRTRWRDLDVTDYLDTSDGRRFQRAGRVDLVRVVRGKDKAIVEFAPRLDFGRTPTRIGCREYGLVIEGSLDPIVLRAPGVTWDIRDEGAHETAIGTIDLRNGPVALELRYGTGSLRDGTLPEHERREQTEVAWSRWASELKLPEVRPDLVRRSALVLKALCHSPSGAIAAAGTTSLPEHIGGVRNWDYRFCWPRDAALASSALVRLGSPREALGFLDWLLNVVDRCESPSRLAPIYTVAGHDLGPEGEIGELAGYAGSRPVRIGNAAARQVQLDVFGPIVDLISVLLDRGAPLSSTHWRLVDAMVTAVRERWEEPDHGIWEVRSRPQHHVHSKTMCWVTLDRATRISEELLGRAAPQLRDLADHIRDEILERGWHEKVGSFTSTYEGDTPDAAALLVGLSGMLDPQDDRFVRTVEAIDRELRFGPTVYRYRYEDGLPGQEGGFNLCTCWLIEAYARVGRIDDARSLFNDYTELIGPTGLLSEEYGPKTRLALGNVPQAYSHLGLIDAALCLSKHA